MKIDMRSPWWFMAVMSLTTAATIAVILLLPWSPGLTEGMPPWLKKWAPFAIFAIMVIFWFCNRPKPRP